MSDLQCETCDRWTWDGDVVARACGIVQCGSCYLHHEDCGECDREYLKELGEGK